MYYSTNSFSYTIQCKQPTLSSSVHYRYFLRIQTELWIQLVQGVVLEASAPSGHLYRCVKQLMYFWRNFQFCKTPVSDIFLHLDFILTPYHWVSRGHIRVPASRLNGYRLVPHKKSDRISY